MESRAGRGGSRSEVKKLKFTMGFEVADEVKGENTRSAAGSCRVRSGKVNKGGFEPRVSRISNVSVGGGNLAKSGRGQRRKMHNRGLGSCLVSCALCFVSCLLLFSKRWSKREEGRSSSKEQRGSSLLHERVDLPWTRCDAMAACFDGMTQMQTHRQMQRQGREEKRATWDEGGPFK